MYGVLLFLPAVYIKGNNIRIIYRMDKLLQQASFSYFTHTKQGEVLGAAFF